MRRHSMVAALVAAAVFGVVSECAAQQGQARLSGFFIGAGLEPARVTETPDGGTSTTESGPGLAVVLGYAFNPMWAVYGGFSGAQLQPGGQDAVLHLDLGMRVHFRAPSKMLVPFAQM